MSDRELLELAAKAAGISIEWSDGWGIHQLRKPGCSTWLLWSPLTDDGDALRLAITVGINVFKGMAEAHRLGIGRVWATEDEVRIDLLAATRRAIVRAAAEIGKAMP